MTIIRAIRTKILRSLHFFAPFRDVLRALPLKQAQFTAKKGKSPRDEKDILKMASRLLMSDTINDLR